MPPKKNTTSLPVLIAVADKVPLARVRSTFIAKIEKQYLEFLTISENGDLAMVANHAGVGVEEIQRLLTKHHIDIRDYQQDSTGRSSEPPPATTALR